MSISPGFFDMIAQQSHWLAGAWLSLACVYFFGNKSLFIMIPIFVIIVAVKEFWYDEYYEDELTRGSNLKDFCFYLLGIFITLFFVLIKDKVTFIK